MDGAIRGWTPADLGGPALEGSNEHLNLTRLDVIRAIHEVYLDAGAEAFAEKAAFVMAT